MLGINLLFAGFILILNGIGGLRELNPKMHGVANILVGMVVGIDAIFQTSHSKGTIDFGHVAVMWIFSLNYILIAAHSFISPPDWLILGVYEIFASLVCAAFAYQSWKQHNGVLLYLWVMWGL